MKINILSGDFRPAPSLGKSRILNTPRREWQWRERKDRADGAPPHNLFNTHVQSTIILSLFGPVEIYIRLQEFGSTERMHLQKLIQALVEELQQDVWSNGLPTKLKISRPRQKSVKGGGQLLLS